MLLIQLGGLSITTITVFILTLIGAKISYRDRDLVKENISFNTREGIVKTIKRIIIITLIIESLGFIMIFSFLMYKGYSFGNSIFYSIFHVISAYNNAGITIFDSNSLMLFNDSYFFNIVSTLLIVLGGIGTIVIYDVYHNRRWKKLKHHTKIVLKMTLILFTVSTILFYLIEPATFIQSIFHSATIRTAGFYSYDYLNAKNITILLTSIFMFIGGAPASTAGGVKITTMYTIFKTTKAKISNKTPISYKKKISNDYDSKAHLVVTLSLFVVLTSLFIITSLEENVDFIKIFFEVFSAFSNTGLSLNLTSSLHVISKINIMVLMFIGRVGVVAFFVSMTNSKVVCENIEYIDLDYLI